LLALRVELVAEITQRMWRQLSVYQELAAETFERHVAMAMARLADSFRLATRALRTMHAFGLAGTRDLAALGLLPAVAGAPDVGDALRRRYLEPLAESGSAAENITTLRAYGGGGRCSAPRSTPDPGGLGQMRARAIAKAL
jgi:hypothetical protein